MSTFQWRERSLRPGALGAETKFSREAPFTPAGQVAISRRRLGSTLPPKVGGGLRPALYNPLLDFSKSSP